VSTPTTPLQTHSAVAQQLIDNATDLWVQAGEQSDSKQGLGIDGRIALVHGLVDLWVKGWVAIVECAIKGPPTSPGSPPAGKPLPSDIIEVSATTYARTFEAKGPFARVGLPKTTLPVSAIGFDPPFLPAGFTQFRIVLTDYNFAGANYTGTIKLSTQSLVPDERVVTVGL
jgi:hypothetical protein